MKLSRSFQFAMNILIHSKLRSWLTIIGIVIGIAAVVSIVSISEGAKQSLEERLSGMGADVITVSLGYSRARGFEGAFRDGGPGGGNQRMTTNTNAKNLTSKDVTVLKGVSNVKYVMGEVSDKADMTYSSKTASISVRGVDAIVWKEITTEKLNAGRFLTQGDSFSVILGGNTVKNTFDNQIPLNGKVTIAGKIFKVVGILEEGSTAHIPIETARVVLENVGETKLDSISVKIKDVDLSDQTVTDITQKLMLSRGIFKEEKKDFSVSSPKAMQENMQQTMNTMTLFLGAIAAISLIVGAIGIANTMFTSVLEKTKEIGIMKAIGARNRDILTIFILNSAMIGLVGGIGGLMLGTFGSGVISYLSSSATGGIARMFGSTLVTARLLMYSLLFSMVIGIIAGVAPAYRASKLKPVDALRYE